MRSGFVLLLVSLFGFVISFNQVPVFVGYNSGVTEDARNTAMNLFNVKLLSTFARELDMDDENAIADAINLFDMEVLFLCEGTTSFPTSVAVSNLINTFVMNGGILLYTASSNDLRSNEVSIWLNNPMFDVSSSATPYDISYYYFNTARYYGSYYANTRAQSTYDSLLSTFGRIDYYLSSQGEYTSENTWGLPFRQLSPDMYWIEDNQRRMELTPENEEYCMFVNNPSVGGQNCWLFQFPHGVGYAIEFASQISSLNFFSLEFTDRLLAIIEAAVFSKREQEMFPSKGESVVVVPEEYGKILAHNIVYDLNLKFDVYLANRFELFPTFLSLSNSDTLAFTYVASDQLSDVFDFAQNGGNVVIIKDANGAKKILEYDGITGILTAPYGIGLYNSYPYNESGWSSIYPGISGASYLPGVPYLYGLDNVPYSICRFDYSTSSGLYCEEITTSSGSGLVSFLSWDFSKTSNRYYIGGGSNSRTEKSWPQVNWRQTLQGAVKPLSLAPEKMYTLDYDYLMVVDPLSVGVYINTNYYSPSSPVTQSRYNIYRFLDVSGHDVSIINNLYALTPGMLSNYDAIVVYLFYPESLGDSKAYFQDFVYNGGRMVFMGYNSANNLQDFFDENNYQSTDRGSRGSNLFIDPLGQSFVSKYTPNTIFSNYYREYGFRGLPVFRYNTDYFYKMVYTPSLSYMNADYCAYYTTKVDPDNYDENYYCGVWSKHFGNGDITFLATRFRDSGTGFKNTYLRSSPWARVLNIAIGADPNDPSASPTRSISSSVSPTVTQTPSATITVSSSSSSTIMTSIPSLSPTPSQTPSATITVSVSESTTSSISSSSTATSSITTSVSPTNTRTPSKTRTKSKTSSISITATSSISQSNSISRSSSNSVSTVFSSSPTASNTNSISASRTSSETISTTESISISPSISETNTASISFSATESISLSVTQTSTKSVTSSASPSKTSSISLSSTQTITVSITGTFSPSPSKSSTNSKSQSPTSSISKSESSTYTPTSSITFSLTPTPNPSETRSITKSATSTRSATSSSTETRTMSGSSSNSISPSESRTASISTSPTKTGSSSGTGSISESNSESVSLSKSISTQPSKSISSTLSSTISISISLSNTISMSISSSSNLSVITSPIPIPSLSQLPIASQIIISVSPSISKIIPSIVSQSRSAIASITPNIIPTSAEIDIKCSDCEYGETQMVIDKNEIQDIQLSISEITLGSIIIPNNVENTRTDLLIDVSYVTNFLSSENIQLGSTIVDITLTDSFGTKITELDEPITICFNQNEVDDDSCLSFYNEDTEEWECEDYCLELVGDEYCGKTNHLTSFALLLNVDGSNGGNGACGSSNNDYLIYAWISLGLVGFSLIIFIIAVISIELRYRRKQLKVHARLKSIESMNKKNLTPTLSKSS